MFARADHRTTSIVGGKQIAESMGSAEKLGLQMLYRSKITTDTGG